MPLNEASRKPRRERWPLEFDLTGVPRDARARQQLIDQQQEQESMAVKNSFTVDKPTTAITDINNPPKTPYNLRDPKNEFPKMLYHHESGRVLTVADSKEQEAALKRGFDLKPSLHHDYSKVSRVGIAPVAEREAKSEENMTAAELVALDEGGFDDSPAQAGEEAEEEAADEVRDAMAEETSASRPARRKK